MEEFFLMFPTSVLQPHPRVRGHGRVMGKPHQPPKSSWVNTPSSLVHTSECCACPKAWSGGSGYEEAFRGTAHTGDMNVVQEKNLPAANGMWDLQPTSRPHLSWCFLSSLSTTGLRKCKMRKLQTFTHMLQDAERDWIGKAAYHNIIYVSPKWETTEWYAGKTE